MSVIGIILGYLILMNGIGFLSMYLDKQKARKRAFRIPESTLFMIAVIGGSIGSLLGMHLCRHKTRHLSFTLGIPAILILQFLVLVALILLPINFTFL